MKHLPRRLNSNRRRAMRLALWAQHLPASVLTPEYVSAILRIDVAKAAKWRSDLMAALNPINGDGLAPYRAPAPSEPNHPESSP